MTQKVTQLKSIAEQVAEAVEAAVDDQKLRAEALKLAISSIRKMPYGNPGVDASIKLANAYYSFLKGEPR